MNWIRSWFYVQLLSLPVLYKQNILFIKSRIIKANSSFEFFVLCKNKSKKQTQNEQKIKWFTVFLNYIKTYFIGSKTVKWNCAFIIIGGNNLIIMWLTEQIKSPNTFNHTTSIMVFFTIKVSSDGVLISRLKAKLTALCCAAIILSKQ